MRSEEFGERCDLILSEVERAIVGKRDALELVLLGLLADGHVLIEDYPGLAKTLIARSFAQVTSMEFARIQFTPDLMPSDVTGASIFDQRAGEFDFRPGPIFTNLLLADEINRAPPKTQAALLEAMQGGQVTSEVSRARSTARSSSSRRKIRSSTRGRTAARGTLDRFLLRIGVGYPERDEEWNIVARRIERETDEVILGPVVGREELLELQAPRRGHIAESVGYYIVDVVGATRRAAASRWVRALAEPWRSSTRPRPRALGWARLRHAGRREGRRRACARAPDDARPELWVQRSRRSRSAEHPGGGSDAGRAGPSSRFSLTTRTTAPRLTAYAGLAAFGLLAAVALGRLSSPSLRRRSRSSLPWACRSRGRRRCASSRPSGRSAPSRARLSSSTSSCAPKPDTAMPRFRGGLRADDRRGHEPRARPSGCRAEPRARVEGPMPQLGRIRPREVALRTRDPLGLFVYEQKIGRATPLKGTVGRALRSVPRPLATQPRRAPGRSRTGRRYRVRRPQAVRPRRPAAANQLARHGQVG